MILNFTNTDNKQLSIKIEKEGHDYDWSSLMKCDDRNFKFQFDHDGESHVGHGVRGDDALWIPYAPAAGLKIVANNPKYQSLSESLETVQIIQKSNSLVFPQVYSSKILSEQDSNEEYLVIVMENMGNPARRVVAPQYVPHRDREHIQRTLQL